MTSLEDPAKVIASPAGFFMAPEGEERIGDVSNVLFTNGWIADENGTVLFTMLLLTPVCMWRLLQQTGWSIIV